jgi:hypothetical protein
LDVIAAMLEGKEETSQRRHLPVVQLKIADQAATLRHFGVAAEAREDVSDR